MRVGVTIKDEKRIIAGLLALSARHPDAWSGAFGGPMPVPARVQSDEEARFNLQQAARLLMAPHDPSYSIHALTGDDGPEWGWRTTAYDPDDTGRGGCMGLRYSAAHAGWLMTYHGSRHSLHQSGVASLYQGLGGDHWARTEGADPVFFQSHVDAPWWIAGVMPGVRYREELWFLHGQTMQCHAESEGRKISFYRGMPEGFFALAHGLGIQHLDYDRDFSLHRGYRRPTEPEAIREGEIPSFTYFEMYPTDWGWQAVLTVAEAPWAESLPYAKIRSLMAEIGAEPGLGQDG